LIALSKLLGIFGPFFRPSKVADVGEELTKLLAKSSKGFALYLMSRAEHEELSSPSGGQLE
jgi:hypothetical protein